MRKAAVSCFHGPGVGAAVPSARAPCRNVGGTEPVWSKDGTELFYRSGEGELMAVEVSEESGPDPSRQQPLFLADDYLIGAGHPMYDVSADGERFIMLRVKDVELSAVVLVQNFFEVLRQRVPN